MHTWACTQRETAERLAAVLLNLQQLPLAQDSASQAGPSDHQNSIFHTLPHHCGNPDDPDNGPGNGSDGGGSSDRGIPEDPAELPEDPLLALMWAVHDLACSSQQSGDSTPKTKGMVLAWFEPNLLNPGNPLNCPLWMDDYQECLSKLTTNFSPHDAVADAVQQLENLTSVLKSSCRTTKKPWTGPGLGQKKTGLQLRSEAPTLIVFSSAWPQAPSQAKPQGWGFGGCVKFSYY
ncbi:hypothetical protein EDC04DRAFT_2607996 [Pisolithus marmoratus]|nr:hypothetical protein EDC04DRAFT_2607996 [Pisolithus marmoratus]